MKVCKKISLGVVIIVFMFFIGITTSSASLIAYFPFDGNAKDAQEMDMMELYMELR